MTITIGAVCNVFNEAEAISGWLENVSQFADHIAVYHAGPGGTWSTDGTMEILEKWHIPVHRGSIDYGFGVVRSATLRASPCEWVMLLDADERLYPYAPVLNCTGESTPPDEVNQILQEYDCRTQEAVPSNWENLAKLGAKLEVTVGDIYNQIAWVREFLQYGSLDAVMTIRRHWHDFSWKRPTQNWLQIPDYQSRFVRNADSIHFEPNVRMHEQLANAPNRYRPNFIHGPFFDHYHCFFKKQTPLKRKFAVAVYDAIHFGTPMPSWEEFKVRAARTGEAS